MTKNKNFVWLTEGTFEFQSMSDYLFSFIVLDKEQVVLEYLVFINIVTSNWPFSAQWNSEAVNIQSQICAVHVLIWLAGNPERYADKSQPVFQIKYNILNWKKDNLTVPTYFQPYTILQLTLNFVWSDW